MMYVLFEHRKVNLQFDLRSRSCLDQKVTKVVMLHVIRSALTRRTVARSRSRRPSVLRQTASEGAPDVAAMHRASHSRLAAPIHREVLRCVSGSTRSRRRATHCREGCIRSYGGCVVGCGSARGHSGGHGHAATKQIFRSRALSF